MKKSTDKRDTREIFFNGQKLLMKKNKKPKPDTSEEHPGLNLQLKSMIINTAI